MLADQATVEALLGRELTTEEADRLTALEALVSADVTAATGQTFTHVDNDPVTLTATRGEVWIPQAPITDITSVTVDPDLLSVVLARPQWTLNGQRLSLTAGPWAPADRSPRWDCTDLSTYTGPVALVYSHGPEAVPGDVAGAVAGALADTYRRQAQFAANPDGMTGITVAGYQAQWGTGTISAPAAAKIDQATLDTLACRYGPGSWSPKVGR